MEIGYDSPRVIQRTAPTPISVFRRWPPLVIPYGLVKVVHITIRFGDFKVVKSAVTVYHNWLESVSHIWLSLLFLVEIT